MTEQRQQIAELVRWMRATYGGVGVGDVLRVARQEGISADWETVYEVLRTGA